MKGQSDLIRATAIVKQEIPEVEVRIYGASTDADYFDQCQQLVAEKQLEKNIIFAGLTKEPWRVYSDADIVVLPSISEGFPYVVVEAMMCGAAIVASDVGGVREALGSAGLLTPSRSPAALAKAILSLLHNPAERQRLGAMAMERALNSIYGRALSSQLSRDLLGPLSRHASPDLAARSGRGIRCVTFLKVWDFS